MPHATDVSGTPSSAPAAVPEPVPARAPLTVLVAVVLLSGAVLALEIIFTRILSVLTWHHFVFLILGTALLGFGAAGTTLTLGRASRRGLASPRHIPTAAYLFGVTSLACAYLLVVLRPEPLWIETNAIEIPKLVASELLVALPFYFAGLCLGHLIDRFRGDIGRVYSVDLVAGGLGSLVSTLAIERIGAVNLLAVIAAMGVAAGLLLEDRAGSRRIGPALALPGLLALALAVTSPPDVFFVPPSPTKELAWVPSVGPLTNVLDVSRWHPIARIDITVNADVILRGFGGSLDPTLHLRHDQRLVFQDGSAPTGILESSGDVRKLSFLGAYLQASPYVVQSSPRTLVIGVGGGIDVLIALFHGASHVTGIEINPWVVDAITRRYRDYSGGLLSGKNVDILLDEGRHFSATARASYDVIQLSGVDTFTALASGAYALAESYLYTREAIEGFYRLLAPGGILSFSRHFMVPPRETLRLVATMAEAMDRLGVVDPARHVFITSASGWADTMMRRSPFTREDCSSLRQWAAAHHFEIVYDPYAPRPESPYDAVLRCTPGQRELLYQLYVYDVRPALDDRPFFFDYYKWRNLFHLQRGTGGYPPTRLPFGLMTLLASLGVGLALAGTMILLPLGRLGAAPSVRPGHRPMLAYFSALGVAYIAIEIVTIQRLMVYLGGPAYATSIALAALLVFSGAGSLVAGTLDIASSRRRRLLLAAALPVAVVLFDPVIRALVGATAGWSMVARALLAAFAVAPMAFLMGMPFPVGIQRLDLHAPDWIPWAWGVNAFATVVGSPGSVLLAMTLGFATTLRLAALVYLLGLLAFERLEVQGY